MQQLLWDRVAVVVDQIDREPVEPAAHRKYRREWRRLHDLVVIRARGQLYWPQLEDQTTIALLDRERRHGHLLREREPRSDEQRESNANIWHEARDSLVRPVSCLLPHAV